MAISGLGGTSGGTGSGPASLPADASYPPEALSSLIFQETKKVVTLNTATLIVPSSASRVYLALYIGAAAQTLSMATVAGNLVAGNGPAVTITAPLVLNWATNASAVNQAWYGISAQSPTVMIHEIFYRPLALRPDIMIEEDEEDDRC